MTNIRPATTVILLRQETKGFRVFMVKRHRAVGFLPNAWVFPGGRVDAPDRLAAHPAVTGGNEAVRQLGLSRAEGVAWLVAGVRETFEETGIWLGEGSLPEVLRARLELGEVALGSVMEENGARLNLDGLRGWARWITPELEPRRYDTRFIVAACPEGGGSHDHRETVDSCWLTPQEALARVAARQMMMVPPTWWTLRELAEHMTVDEVFLAAERRSMVPIEPIAQFDGGAFELVLPGHPKHPQPAHAEIPSSIRFDEGRWWADEGRTD